MDRGEEGGGGFPEIRIAAVGQGTARALAARGRPPGITPPPGAQWSSEGLLRHPALAPEAVEGARIWIVRGRGGREHLARELLRRGAVPFHLEVYERRAPRPRPRELRRVREAGRRGELEAVVLTSAQAATHLLAMLRGECWVREVRFVVPSERVGAVLVDAGIAGERIVVARRSGDGELLDAVVEAMGGGGARPGAPPPEDGTVGPDGGADDPGPTARDGAPTHMKRRAEAEIVNRLGMHARAAAALLDTVSRFDARVRLEKGGREADAASIMELLMLEAPRGTVVTVTAEGPEAEAALEATLELIRNRFGEGE